MKDLWVFRVVVILALSLSLIMLFTLNATDDVEIEYVPTATDVILVEPEPPKAPEQPTQVVKINEVERTSYFDLSDYERSVVEKMVAGEAQGEPYEGQMLVAQCILNACLKDSLKPSEVRRAYQYSGWNENPSESVKEAVTAVFDYGHKIVDDNILWFYAPRWSNSKWHESQRFVIEVGGHRFFAERRGVS